jgi:AcrR family transcriptional regulator
VAEGLRERKKQQMRRALSDAAAAQFLRAGFDGVRMADVADACGVSEKTVYNYFATKEALVMDRLEGSVDALAAALGDGDPVDACLGVLAAELDSLAAGLHAGGAGALAGYRRYGDLIRATPSLRAYQSEMHDRLVAVIAGHLRERGGRPAGDPPAEIAAQAVAGLVRVQFRSLRRHVAAAADAGSELDVQSLRARVAADVAEAAEVSRAAVRALN